MWFVDPASSAVRVPMYPVLPFLSSCFPWAFKPFFNNSLAALSAFSLVYCLGSVVWNNPLPTGDSIVVIPTGSLALFMLSLLVLCTLDLWRFLQHHYPITACAAFLFACPDISLRVMLAGLYFWSGFSKTFNRDFFHYVVPGFFAPVRAVLRCLGISPWVSDVLVKCFAFVGVVGESLMGLVLWFGPSSFYLKHLAALFNVGMHCYIIVYVGLVGVVEQPPSSLRQPGWASGSRRPRYFIVAWNAMSMALTQVLLCPEELLSVNAMLFPLWQFSTLVVLLMVVLPLTMLVGACPDACLAHAYFAPGWFPLDMLLVPRSVAVNHAGAQNITTEGEIFQSALLLAAEMMMQSGHRQWVALDGKWLDRTHLLDNKVEWANALYPGPVGFWRVLVDVLGVPCILVRQGVWGGCDYTDSATVLFPRKKRHSS